MNITGQSVKLEPIILGKRDLYHPSSLERFLKATSKSSTVYNLEKKDSQIPMSSIETLQRTLAENQRGQVRSSNISYASPISGRASTPFNSEYRRDGVNEGYAMLKNNNNIVKQNTPDIY